MKLEWEVLEESHHGHTVWIADSGFDHDVAIQWDGKSWCYWPVDPITEGHPLYDYEAHGFDSPDEAKAAAQTALDKLLPQSK